MFHLLKQSRLRMVEAFKIQIPGPVGCQSISEE